MKDIDKQQRAKHKHRIAYASACVMGHRARVIYKAGGKARSDKSGIYTISGIRRKFVGYPEVVEKLADLGINITAAVLGKQRCD